MVLLSGHLFSHTSEYFPFSPMGKLKCCNWEHCGHVENKLGKRPDRIHLCMFQGPPISYLPPRPPFVCTDGLKEQHFAACTETCWTLPFNLYADCPSSRWQGFCAAGDGCEITLYMPRMTCRIKVLACSIQHMHTPVIMTFILLSVEYMCFWLNPYSIFSLRFPWIFLHKNSRGVEFYPWRDLETNPHFWPSHNDSTLPSRDLSAHLVVKLDCCFPLTLQAKLLGSACRYSLCSHGLFQQHVIWKRFFFLKKRNDGLCTKIARESGEWDF